MREDLSQDDKDRTERDVAWRPRRQSPASSYTSMRSFRDGAAKGHPTGEVPAITPSTSSGSSNQRRRFDTAPQHSRGAGEDAPLPRPGAPLFGPRGIVTGPLPSVSSATARPARSRNAEPPSSRPRFPDSGADRLTPSRESAEPLAARRPYAGTQATARIAPDGSASGANAARDADTITELARWLSAPSIAVATLPDRSRADDDVGMLTNDPPEPSEKNARKIGRRSLPRQIVGVLRYRPSRRLAMICASFFLVIAVLAIAGQPLLHAFAAGNLPGKKGQPIPGGAGKPVATVALPTSIPQSYLPMPLDVEHPPPVLWAESAVVMDGSNGTILYAKNPNEPLPMASTTKLMSAVVALAHGSPDQAITISQNAADTGGARVDLKVGEHYSLRELLYGMLLVSGNDAAEAIADGLGGNQATFVGWMNATAIALGMNTTHYKNPHGLDEDQHYSSAKDLAILGRYAVSIGLIHEITNAANYTIPETSTHGKKTFSNLHQIQWWYPGANGGKPGWTDNAQFVDVVSAVRDGHQLVAVVMRSQHDWVTDIRNLLNWGFNNFTWVSPREINQQHWIPFDDAYSHFNWDVPSRTITVGDRRYYPFTGFTISGGFLAFYDAKGGLNVFGYPRGMPVPGENGQLVQHFDQATIACDATATTCAMAPKS